jgi:hypothetical protein
LTFLIVGTAVIPPWALPPAPRLPQDPQSCRLTLWLSLLENRYSSHRWALHSCTNSDVITQELKVCELQFQPFRQ